MKLNIVKKKNDPITNRISIGGNNTEAYIVYRGNIADIKMLLDEVNELFKKLKKEPPISDDGGKNYA